MNTLDKQYQELLQTILDYGVEKKDRTGTGTKSIFGYTIRHNMKEGFPLLTTKKMFTKGVIVELLWFLRGDTNIKFLVDNDCHIWDGDAYKAYLNECEILSNKVSINDMQSFYKGPITNGPQDSKKLASPLSQEEFINKIKTDDEFAKKWGELGPVYGKQWRAFGGYEKVPSGWNHHVVTHYKDVPKNDQIATLINDLKTNPDSRRLMVNAWNVGELDQMVLPPCHYGFQVYTRELSEKERIILAGYDYENRGGIRWNMIKETVDMDNTIPRRAISLMWNQRSVDTFLGLPFNIASYGLLLEIIAKEVNMVPDELIGNLGDTHLYLNHIEQAKEQIGRELSIEERIDLASKKYDNFDILDFNIPFTRTHEDIDEMYPVERRTREPYPLPTLKIESEVKWSEGDCLPTYSLTDFTIENYQSHPTIKAPLSN